MPTKDQISQSARRRREGVALCSRCQKEKRWECFDPDPSRRPFGLKSNCKSCELERKAEAKRKDYWKNPEYYGEHRRRARLKENFGITAEQYTEMFEAQDGKCAICKKAESDISFHTGEVQRLAVDHNHSSGKVRSLLCGKCNKGIGCFSEDPELMRDAIKYLQSHSDRGDVVITEPASFQEARALGAG